MQNERYSTTRRKITEKPDCFDASVDGPITLLKTSGSAQKIAEGGLRLQGQYKTSAADKPLITVVTVVYNGVEFLEDTIKSVIKQTYDNVEYIIVDGGSTDGTSEIIRKYEHAIDYWVSEPDRGIYDAMNKAIDLGCGKWINFMNAGDSFFDASVLAQVFSGPSVFTGFDVIYGNHEVVYSNKKKIVEAGKTESLWKGSQFCHQSAFVRLNYHKIEKFNICRNIAADFEFFYNSKKTGSKTTYQPYVFSRISAGGVSDARRIDSILEWWLIVDKNNFINTVYCLRIINEVFKVAVKKILRK